MSTTPPVTAPGGSVGMVESVFEGSPGDRDLVCGGGCRCLCFLEYFGGGVVWYSEILYEGVLGVFVIAASHAEEESDRWVDCPSLLAKVMCESGVLSFLLV